MDNKQPAGVEALPQIPVKQEKLPGQVDVYVQKSPEVGNIPMPGERMSAANDAVQQAMASVQPVATQALANDDDSTQSTSSLSGTSLIAQDSDIIEKIWIDMAKKIVAETIGDPHSKTKKLTGLKKNYLEKRYGKQLKVATDESGK
ncbi:MAG: hypothetical protein MUF85_00475 [Patescibacteria group bacterium]|jgi:hypothetical protein|nr:hypothetical protein [Patescibacteria group bacterium]